MSQLHLDVDPAPAQAPLRPGGRHQGAEDPVPRDDHGRRRGRPPAQEADRRPRPVRRGPPARLPAAARDQDAGAAARSSSPTRAKFEKLRIVPLRPGLQLRLHRPHRRRHDPEPVHARPSRRAARSCWNAGRWPATACRTSPSRSTSASTTTWTSSEAAFKTAGRHGVQEGVPGRPAGAAGADREPGGDGARRKYTGAILGDLNTKRAHVENQDSLPGDLAVIMRPGAAGGGDPVRGPARQHHAGPGLVHDGVQPLRPGAGNVQQQIVSKAKVGHDEEE